jgi:hypothetical protein
MTLCRCPHCRATFQVSIPHDHEIWDRTALDEEGLVMWVCMECHRKGLLPVDEASLRAVGHDTSYRQHK